MLTPEESTIQGRTVEGSSRVGWGAWSTKVGCLVQADGRRWGWRDSFLVTSKLTVVQMWPNVRGGESRQGIMCMKAQINKTSPLRVHKVSISGFPGQGEVSIVL